MANFQLNEEDGMATVSNRRPKKTKVTLTQKAVNLGLVKSESQAKLIMIVFIVIGFGLIVYMNLQTFSVPADSPAEMMP